MLLVTALSLVLLAVRDAGHTTSLPSISIPAFGTNASERLLPSPPPRSVEAPDPALVLATETSNIYLRPDRAAERVAVLPAAQRAALLGRLADGAWLLVAYPVGSATRGWIRAASFDLARPRLDALAVLPPSVLAGAAPAPAPVVALASLPDIVITDLVLLQGDQLTVGIRNIGAAAMGEIALTLHVTSLEGDLIGVFAVAQTSLAPSAVATVVTTLAIPRPGTYRVEIDPANELAEAQKSNNTRQALLVPAKG